MVVATRRTHDAGIRKAAVLVASLDRLSADLLLDQLDDEQADLVRQAVMELDQIDDEERRRVIDEFRRIGPMVPSASPSGIELTDLPPKRTESTAPPDAPANDDSRPFGFLHEAEDEKLMHLLADERPPTIALVLSHLPPERAANVLDRLAPALQVEVIRRLVDLENADPETLREIEQVLEARLSRLFDLERRRAAGPQSVARILASCEGLVRRRILDNISVEDRPLAERFGRREPNFDEIAQCDDAVLAEVFRTAEPEVVRAALLGTPPAMLERFLRCMAPEEAKRIRRRLARPGPIRLSDVEEARREIAGLAERLSCGEVNRTAA
ncbi:MAG: hypothetical protein KKA28_08180 [Planctomycetes bacterium]|nr:hypothetical protein [Planctomycetota bacterium]MCG2683361.1 hypothetical protein [Planctomycetales bacterium]